MNFEDLRKKYPKFLYNSYNIFEEDNKICIEYDFEIENLTKFKPRIEILKKEFVFKDIKSDIVKNMVFNLGLVEAISYFKATCSPLFLIKCGKLDDFQENWFKKLFYLGLGEFRFINNIDISENEFVKFISEGEDIGFSRSTDILDGILIPIGGGKDSNVTLELLKKYKNKSLVFRIGANEVSTNCAKVAGFENEEIVEAVDGEMCFEQAEKLRIIRDHMSGLDLCKANLQSLILSTAEKFIPEIDLVCTVPGMATFSAISVIGEIGADMSVFPTSKHLCSWAGPNQPCRCLHQTFACSVCFSCCQK